MQAGKEQKFILLIRNNFSETKKFKAQLLPPEEWEVINGFNEISLSPGSSGKIIMTAKAPASPANRTFRQLVTTEIYIDGVSRGPIAEALAQIIK